MQQRKTLCLANDHGGVALRPTVFTVAQTLDFDIIDFGTDQPESVDYPLYVKKLCETMKMPHNHEFGILICGSGIGVSIAANRFSHIRAALCSSAEDAVLSRQHNNANVLCLSGRTLSPEDAEKIITLFLTTPFEGGRHQRRLEQIETITC